MKRTLLLFILAIATSGILSAATVFPFKKYRVADGLSHNTANCVIRDSYGFLWIGTGNGLNCYNGQSNRIYRNINGIERTLGNNNVRALMENDSDIWVGTGNGVYIYHRMTDDFTRFDKRTRHDVFVSSEVNRIVRGSDGLIWIATMGQGVFVYDPATDTLTQSILHSSFAWDLCNGTDSIVYVSSLKKGLLLFDRSGRFITSREVIPGSGGDIKINCLLSDNNGGAWFGVDNRLEHCPGTTGTITASELPSGAVILCLSDYGSGRILAGTTDGLYIHDTATGQWERVTSPAGVYNLSCPTVNDLLVDDEGTLWVMTASGGVSYMPRQLQRFKSLTIPDTGMPPGIPCDINAFCQHMADSSVYIGTRLGLWKFDMTTHSLEEYRLGRKYNIKCLMSDGDTLWAGTSGDGLLAIDTRTGRLTRHTHSDRTPNSIPGNTVQAIGKASDGKVYVGTDLGLCSYKPATGNFEVYIVFSAMNPITAIQITANGSIWVGTQNLGLFHRQADNEHWQHYEHVSGDTSSIASNSIVSIFEDADGGIWLGTNGNGLSLYQPDSDNFTNSLTENMPLRNEIIYSITEDDLGYFWIPTDKGLFRIDRANGRHRLYTMSDGLQGDQFIAGSAMKATDGTMYFGGTSGFNMFRPDEIRENAYIPAVHITGITFPDSDNGTTGSFADSSGTPIYLRREISLPYDRNSFTIDFAALSLQDPSRNSYRYMLKGIDSKWIASDTENHARYSHLPPGKYEFMVTGSNNDGFWNDKAATITITITPPWWQSLWAYMVYLLLIGAAMGYIVYLSNRYAKRKFRQRVEAFNLAKEKETYEAKITFFMNLVHEIRTPLSLICLPLEKLRDSRSGDNTRYIG
ncbi:MAG: hybrid sensor histidine kinase/response regulator, partial [Muribaculaceae bacterium]|nr:hybrid sensor histidine kinase/response regulator [Muribaculaceae bacterium]